MKRTIAVFAALVICAVAGWSTGTQEGLEPVDSDAPVEFSIFMRSVPDFVPEGNA